MAMTGWDVLTDDAFYQAVIEDFQRDEKVR